METQNIKKTYSAPAVEEVIMDSDISLVMTSVG